MGLGVLGFRVWGFGCGVKVSGLGLKCRGLGFLVVVHSLESQLQTCSPGTQTIVSPMQESENGCFSEFGSLFRVLFIRVPYWFGDRKLDPNLENCPNDSGDFPL